MRNAANTHPLIGSSAPDFVFEAGLRLRFEGKVDCLILDVKEKCGLKALLIWPDGFFSCVVEENAEADLGAVKTALDKWFIL